MKFNITGKSLLELKDIYGIGKSGFYSDWWKDDEFSKDKPEAGIYEIAIKNKALVNMTYDEQVKSLEKGWDIPHPAVIAEALLLHLRETGEYIMKDWYSRTTLLDSGGDRVRIGGCVAGGVGVDSDWDVIRDGHVGVGACRNLSSLETGNLVPIDHSSLELRVEKLEKIVKQLTLEQFGAGKNLLTKLQVLSAIQSLDKPNPTSQ